jgi:hypothetical protein
MKTEREQITGVEDNHHDREFLNQSCGYSSGIMDADEAYMEIIYDKAKEINETLPFMAWLDQNFSVTRKPHIVFVEGIKE